MPELPELQALVERLETSLGGQRLTALRALQFSALKTALPAPQDLLDRTLTSVRRRGKYLLFDFEGPRLVVHLSQGGRIDVEEPPKATKPRGALLRIEFESHGLLIKEFGTERRAGWWVLAPDDDAPIAHLGPEPDHPAFTKLIRHGDDSRRLHTMLRDQRTVAGIGRGYADDILHRAELSPFRSLAALDADARKRLLEATATVLDEALRLERARTGGLPPKLGDRFAVHNRAGQPCPRCGEALLRVSYESHEVVYCARCQTGGKVLADRRLSRLLR